MSLTYAAQQPGVSGRKAAAIVAVVLLHLGFLYAFTHGLNVVTLIKPLQDTVAVFIPEEIPPPTPLPAIKPVDVPIDKLVPDVPKLVDVQIPPEVNVDVQPDSSAISTDAASDANSVAPAKSFSIDHRVNPQYPAASRRAGESGTVLLDIVVGPNGTATDINVVTSSGYDALDKSAIAAVRQWRFTVNSDTHYARVRLPVTFRLETVR